jgi:hypothetical protein
MKRSLILIVSAFSVVGCGGTDEYSSVSPGLRGLATDPHWLTSATEILSADGTISIANVTGAVSQSFQGYISPPDANNLHVSQVRMKFVDDDKLGYQNTLGLYKTVVNAYVHANINVLLVVNSESFKLASTGVPCSKQAPPDMPPCPNNQFCGGSDPNVGQCYESPQSLVLEQKWSGCGGDPSTWSSSPCYAEAFAARVKDIADHLVDDRNGNPAIDAFEIMNEWNAGDLAQQIDPAAYSALLTDVRTLLPAGKYTLVTGGLLLMSTSDPQDAFNVLVQVDISQADAIGIHPYGSWPGDADWPLPPSLEGQGYTMYTDIVNLFQPLGKPLWVTEWDIADPNLGGDYVCQKARLFRGFFNRFAPQNLVDRAYFFAYDDANDVQGGFGLYADPTATGGTAGIGQPKPYTASFLKWLGGGDVPDPCGQ